MSHRHQPTTEPLGVRFLYGVLDSDGRQRDQTIQVQWDLVKMERRVYAQWLDEPAIYSLRREGTRLVPPPTQQNANEIARNVLRQRKYARAEPAS